MRLEIGMSLARQCVAPAKAAWRQAHRPPPSSVNEQAAARIPQDGRSRDTGGGARHLPEQLDSTVRRSDLGGAGNPSCRPMISRGWRGQREQHRDRRSLGRIAA